MNFNPPKNFLKKILPQWNQYARKEETTLLRLCLLRDLWNDLHAQTSKFLALGDTKQAYSIKNFNLSLETLKKSSLEGDLLDLLSHSSLEPKKNIIIPENFSKILKLEKLIRTDRIWEHSITLEALSLHWSLWKLETWVKIPFVEQWNQHLASKLWPQAVVLFSENALSYKNSSHTQFIQSMHWQGRWWIWSHPDFEVHLKSLFSDECDEIPSPAPSPLSWKRLFPPNPNYDTLD